jgi:hypothetical protein
VTTTYRGKVAERRVIDPGDDARLLCCWDDCGRDGLELHKAREYLGVDPGTRTPIWTWYVFCTERHKMYWVNSVKDLYNLPPGYRLAVI